MNRMRDLSTEAMLERLFPREAKMSDTAKQNQDPTNSDTSIKISPPECHAGQPVCYIINGIRIAAVITEAFYGSAHLKLHLSMHQRHIFPPGVDEIFNIRQEEAGFHEPWNSSYWNTFHHIPR